MDDHGGGRRSRFQEVYEALARADQEADDELARTLAEKIRRGLRQAGIESPDEEEIRPVEAVDHAVENPDRLPEHDEEGEGARERRWHEAEAARIMHERGIQAAREAEVDNDNEVEAARAEWVEANGTMETARNRL